MRALAGVMAMVTASAMMEAQYDTPLRTRRRQSMSRTECGELSSIEESS
jgi:hypothetical protein